MAGSGLSTADVVNVQVNFAPIAAPKRNFGSLLIIGTSPVISTTQRYREYTSIDGVTSDFGTLAAEYLAAVRFFAQTPKPSFLSIGRWAQVATRGYLVGGPMPLAVQAAELATLQAVTIGGMSITLGGVVKTLNNINLSTAVSLTAVAALMNTALAPVATCFWDAYNAQFVLNTIATGVAGGAITYASAGIGTDLATLLNWTFVTGAQLSQGSALETPLAALTALEVMNNNWYGAIFAPVAEADISISDYLACASFIEASVPARIFGINTTNPGTLVAGSTTDLAAQMKAANFERSCVQYSSTDLYAVSSLFGRAFTVDFTANNTAITLKFKQEPVIVAETINETQATALTAKNCNVFVNYNNTTAIIQQGVMTNGFFFDEVQGTDWLADDIQNRVYNLLYASSSKVPQTEAGIHTILTAVSASCQAGVDNGLIAPGIWSGPPVGAVATGQLLPSGYYVYAPPLALQAPADRAARIAPTIQALIKLAGAVHKANIIINVNR